MPDACLKTALDLLRDVRSDLRNDVDARVIQHLDQAIEVLEAEVDSAGSSRSSREAALRALGAALKWLPAVKALLEELLK